MHKMIIKHKGYKRYLYIKIVALNFLILNHYSFTTFINNY